VVDCCEHGNETSGSVKGDEFLNQLSDEGLCFVHLVSVNEPHLN